MLSKLFNRRSDAVLADAAPKTPEPAQASEIERSAPEVLNHAALAPGAVVLGGHSHLTALIGRQNQKQLEQVDLSDECYGLAGPFPRDEDYWRAFGELGRGNLVLLCYGGNEHNAHFLCETQPRFDFLLAAAPQARVDETALLLPESLVDEWFSLFATGLREIVPTILAASPRRFFILGTPAPKRDEAHLRRAIAREPSLLAKAQALGMSADDVRFSAPHLRQKVWAKLQGVYANTAREFGGVFLPVPPASLDEEGFLKPEYQGPDATHANAQYGAMARAHFAAAARAA